MVEILGRARTKKKQENFFLRSLLQKLFEAFWKLRRIIRYRRKAFHFIPFNNTQHHHSQ